MTDAFRRIETESYAKVMPPASFGRPPKLEWLAIRDLVIDLEYQREITPKGRSNIRSIVQHFEWSMFAPVVVAAAGLNKFAIVDGQHRVTAAALCGIDKVPCAIIDAPRAGQAAAFAAINANVTRPQAIALHHAAAAAGDQHALRINAVCKAAGVIPLRYPKQTSIQEVGETMAIATIGRALARFGEATTIAALRAIVSTGGGATPAY